MGDIISASNLKKAGALALANYVAMALASGQSKLVQGAILVAANAVAIPFAMKL